MSILNFDFILKVARPYEIHVFVKKLEKQNNKINMMIGNRYNWI